MTDQLDNPSAKDQKRRRSYEFDEGAFRKAVADLEALADSPSTAEDQAWFDALPELPDDDETIVEFRSFGVAEAVTAAPALDVAISGGGTIYLFHLLTPLARDWVVEHVSADRQMFGDAVAVELRYAADLATGMQRDGLVVGDQEDL